jgi:hypothetical protein
VVCLFGSFRVYTRRLGGKFAGELTNSKHSGLVCVLPSSTNLIRPLATSRPIGIDLEALSRPTGSCNAICQPLQRVVRSEKANAKSAYSDADRLQTRCRFVVQGRPLSGVSDVIAATHKFSRMRMPT